MKLVYQYMLIFAQYINPMLVQCWATVCDAGLTLNHNWMSVFMNPANIRNLSQCWLIVWPSSTTLAKQWITLQLNENILYFGCSWYLTVSLKLAIVTPALVSLRLAGVTPALVSPGSDLISAPSYLGPDVTWTQNWSSFRYQRAACGHMKRPGPRDAGLMVRPAPRTWLLW